MISGSSYFVSGSIDVMNFSNDLYISGSPNDFLNHAFPVPQNSYMQHEKDRSFCEYCHGDTKMDDRGNCVACGAQKRKQEPFW